MSGLTIKKPTVLVAFIGFFKNAIKLAYPASQDLQNSPSTQV